MKQNESRNQVTRENPILRQEGIIPDVYGCMTNKVYVCGEIENNFKCSRSIPLGKMYRSKIIVTRLSGIKDIIPIAINSKLFEQEITQRILSERQVKICGQFRSRNIIGEDGKNHLDLFLYVTHISNELDKNENQNLIYMNGYICKTPICRTTPKGRKITDLLIAVNHPDRRSDYIPCIAWTKNAEFAKNFEVGDNIELYGRIQSREYFKRFFYDSDEGEMRTVYEISILMMQKITDGITKRELIVEKLF